MLKEYYKDAYPLRALSIWSLSKAILRGEKAKKVKSAVNDREEYSIHALKTQIWTPLEEMKRKIALTKARRGIIQRLLSATKGISYLSQSGRKGGVGLRVAMARGLGKVGKYVNDQKAACKRFGQNRTYYLSTILGYVSIPGTDGHVAWYWYKRLLPFDQDDPIWGGPWNITSVVNRIF